MFLGVVVKSTGNLYRVKLEDGSTVECTVRGKLRLKGSKTTNPLTVGDRVNVETSHEGTAVIVDILPRTNYIIRRSTNLSRESHIIAANIDQAILVVTIIQPETQTAFIDRYLVTSEAYSIPAILVFNKVDISFLAEAEI
ncbi:MAG TPA: GTPase RsgA, partial [Tenuifilaceae bacterium]|nr:GTPase RsgA [Tenuifilaceae bacterium]